MRTLFPLAATMALILACSTEAPAPEGDQDTDEPPNILLISIDTLRAGHLGSHGYHRDTSPFLDQLAANGIRFPNAFVNTHGTPPSHATLFTSLYQETHGVNQKRPIPANAPMLTEILRDHGYLNLAVTGGGFMSENFGFDRGFEAFRTGRTAIDVASRRFVEMVSEHRDDPRPVFAFFHTYEVHSPYLPPPRYRKMFGEYDSDFEPVSEALVAIKDDAAAHLDQDDVDFLVAMYDGGIRYADDVLRKMFQQLEELGFFDRAIVVITSDHGEEFLEHGGVLHGVSLYEELIHVPLILQGHGISSGVVDETMVSLVDLAPTILSIAGIETPEIMAGRDILTASTVPPEKQAVFSQYRELLYSIRTPRWKLILDTKKKKKILFDLENDPQELKDVADEYPQRVRNLNHLLRTWRKNTFKLEDADTQEVEIGAEQAERLKSLGYID